MINYELKGQLKQALYTHQPQNTWSSFFDIQALKADEMGIETFLTTFWKERDIPCYYFRSGIRYCRDSHLVAMDRGSSHWRLLPSTSQQQQQQPRESNQAIAGGSGCQFRDAFKREEKVAVRPREKSPMAVVIILTRRRTDGDDSMYLLIRSIRT